MPPPLDVCIRGAGVVGRTLALLLARERLRVGLVEQPAPVGSGASDVRAYALNAASRDLLDMLRAWPDPAHATPVLGMGVHGDDGGAVRFAPGAPDGPAMAWIVDVAALQQRLAEALRYQPLVTLLAAPQPAALTVVCEGKASSTRAEFGVGYTVMPYPQQAIAARVSCEKNHGQIARQWFANGEILALLPLEGQGAQHQGNSAALVWSVVHARAQALVEASAQEFEAELAKATGTILGALHLATERASWPLQRALADRWCGAGWALAGDAAHTVHPLAGQGLNLGLADARELAKVIAGREYWRGVGEMKLLRRYERARKADVQAMGVATDGLQQLFARQDAPSRWARNRGMQGFDGSGPFKRWVVRQAAGRL